MPKSIHNDGNYIISLSELTRWLGEQAEALGVDIFPGTAADSVIYEDNIVILIIFYKYKLFFYYYNIFLKILYFKGKRCYNKRIRN